jgi:uronate dehydrogenase
MRTVLMTGAAGDVGTRLRPMLRERYGRLVLTDRAEIADLAPNETFFAGDLDDPAAMTAACEGVDGIVHLGGQPTEAPWPVVDASNVQGFVTLMEAARRAGAARVVFASSNHAVGMYPRHRRIGAENRVRPDTLYGLSKAFGEALCALYADKHGMRCLSIRIGNVSDVPADLRRLSIWLHPEDLFQLVTIGLEHPDLHNEIVFGVSDNAMSFWDSAAAAALGYRPRHRAEDHREQAMAAQAGLPVDEVGDRLQGGGFGSAGFDGDVERTLRS